jgi:guanosine-3',5'-bis(diphosphate) 3'-pyrophosphohydrolase
VEDKINSLFGQLIDSVKGYNPNADLETIKAAFEFARVAHADEKRLSGTPIILHPLETALILASWKMDRDTVVAGLLHDTVEHGAATREDILNAFGEDILFLVEGITKTANLKLKGSDEEFFVENLRKMFFAIAKDLRIVFLRLAERIDNLKSLDVLPPDRRKSYAEETLEIYSPLAERLGMWRTKNEMDDLAFKYAFPNDYERVYKMSLRAYKDAEKKIIKMKNNILAEIKKQGIENVEIYGRKKSLYSLYNKLKRPDVEWNLDKVLDIVALRVLSDSVPNCYIALGIVHNLYKPVPHVALADFIAVPKPNGYRSIHTKVYGPGGRIVEVQIRTFEMNIDAEYGAGAHWQLALLKSKGKLDSKGVDKGEWSVSNKKLEWVRQLAEWQKEVKDNKEFLKAVKFDALSRRIFVFSPKGDVFDLPVNATPVDYAYAVHTGLGYLIKGAKVNGKIVPLDYKMNSGEVIEILKYKNPTKPNSDWLEFVVTTLAKKEIKKQLKDK